MDELSTSFSPLSLDWIKKPFPQRELESSLSAGWTSLLVRSFESSVIFQSFETCATPDLSAVIQTQGISEVESFSGGRWKKATILSGSGGLTAGDTTDRLRIRRLDSTPVRFVNIHIPAYYLAAAHDEYRRAGSVSTLEQPDAHGLTDPLLAQTAFALLEAVKAGAPNLYAESAAQFLATHLLAKNSPWRASVTRARKPGALTDRRLERVLEFMRYHYAENLSLDQLAAEAGISRFHFIEVFKQAVGETPVQYLLRHRLDCAAELLVKTDLSLQQIAENCGFITLSHFSAAFRRCFGQTASEYRRKQSGSF